MNIFKCFCVPSQSISKTQKTKYDNYKKIMEFIDYHKSESKEINNSNFQNEEEKDSNQSINLEKEKLLVLSSSNSTDFKSCCKSLDNTQQNENTYFRTINRGLAYLIIVKAALNEQVVFSGEKPIDYYKILLGLYFSKSSITNKVVADFENYYTEFLAFWNKNSNDLKAAPAKTICSHFSGQKYDLQAICQKLNEKLEVENKKRPMDSSLALYYAELQNLQKKLLMVNISPQNLNDTDTKQLINTFSVIYYGLNNNDENSIVQVNEILAAYVLGTEIEKELIINLIFYYNELHNLVSKDENNNIFKDIKEPRYLVLSVVLEKNKDILQQLIDNSRERDQEGKEVKYSINKYTPNLLTSEEEKALHPLNADSFQWNTQFSNVYCSRNKEDKVEFGLINSLLLSLVNLTYPLFEGGLNKDAIVLGNLYYLQVFLSCEKAYMDNKIKIDYILTKVYDNIKTLLIEDSGGDRNNFVLTSVVNNVKDWWRS